MSRIAPRSPTSCRVCRSQGRLFVLLRFAGQDIQIKLRSPHNGRRNFQGELLGCKDGKVGLRLDKDDVELEFTNIEKARLVPRFD